MSAFVYTVATEKIADAALNLGTADLRVKLLMSNTTADTERDALTLATITTLDEFDGAGYAELDLASLTTTRVDGSDRTQVDAANGTFGATVAAGTRSIVALLYYVYIDGGAGDYPLTYDDTPSVFAGGTFNGDGGPLTIAFDATGFLHLAA